MEVFLWLLGITFAVTILACIASAVALKKHRAAASLRFRTLNDFAPDDMYLGGLKESSVGYDSNRQKLCFLDSALNPEFYHYRDILEIQIAIDGQTVTSQSTGSVVGRAAVGGLLAGGVGAIIGGTTGSRTSKEEISQIQLKIIVNNSSKPLYRVNFLNTVLNTKVKKNSSTYRNSLNQAEKWHGVLTTLIRQGLPPSQPSVIINISAADEIAKLKKLLDDGVINEAEFGAGKAKLLTS